MKYLDPKADLTFKKVFGHPDLLNDPQIGKALEEVKISAFTEDELRAYDKFWDSVRVEKTLQHDSYQEGLEDGVEKGIQQGIQQGEQKANLATARNLLQMGLSAAQVTQATGLSQEQIEGLKK